MQNNIPRLIDWNQIETVLFDMDGTLLDLHFDNYFWIEHMPRAYMHKHGLSDLEVVKAQTFERIMAKKGTLEWYCFDFWEEDLSLDIMALKDEIKHKIQLRPFAIEFLQYLQALGKKLVLTTNSHRKGVDLKFDNSPIEPYFEQVVSSHDYGYAKEHPLFWENLEQNIHFDKQSTLFIDDSVAVQEAATQYGIGEQILILKPDSTKEALMPDANSLENYVCIKHFDEVMYG